jgi:lipoprotein signal peptidase
MKKILAITFLVLLIDQASKIYVKTHFELNESVPVIEGFLIKLLLKIQEWLMAFTSEASSENTSWLS